MSVNELTLFSQNLKKTALGVRFAKALYLNPGSINSKIATNVLKELGFPLPTDTLLAVEGVQAIVAGAAIVEKYQQADDYTNYNELFNMSMATVSTINTVATKLNIVDKRTSTQIDAGVCVASLFASCGTDVSSWMKLGMLIGIGDMTASMEATMQGALRAQEKVKSKYGQETKDFAENIRDLQTGKTGLFSFLAESVDEMPLMFNSVIGKNPAFQFIRDAIPGLNFLPKGPWVFEGVGTSESWYGAHYEDKIKIRVEGLVKSSGLSAADFLIQNLIMPQFTILSRARAEWLSWGKADIYNVALFALFEKNFLVTKDMDLLQSFIKYQISPYEIFERNTFAGAIDSKSKAVQSNFGYSVEASRFTGAEMNVLDMSGTIDKLNGDPQATQLIRKRFNFQETNIERQAQGYLNQTANFRDMSNFIAVMDFLDLIYTDPQYEKIKRESKLLSAFQDIPRIQDFKLSFMYLMNKSIIRRVNKASLLNVAIMTGVPIDKLQYTTQPGQPTIFKGK